MAFIFLITYRTDLAVVGILGIVLLKYNLHKQNLKIAEKTFKEGENSIKSKDYGFFKSVSYAAHCLLESISKSCKQLHTRRNVEEINYMMQI